MSCSISSTIFPSRFLISFFISFLTFIFCSLYLSQINFFLFLWCLFNSFLFFISFLTCSVIHFLSFSFAFYFVILIFAFWYSCIFFINLPFMFSSWFPRYPSVHWNLLILLLLLLYFPLFEYLSYFFCYFLITIFCFVMISCFHIY